jgi:predicted MFS family arabinose efflux permease
VGRAVAGGFIGVATAGGAYLVQALILLVSTIATILMHVPNRPPTSGESHGAPAGSFFRSTVEGWRYIASNPTIRAGMIVAAWSSLLGQPLQTLLPVFARDVLQVGPTGQGFLLTGMGIGALCAGVLIASMGDSLPKGKLMIAGTTVLGLALVGFSFSHWFGVSLAFMFVIGVMNPASHALVQTVLQAHSAPAMRGRVMAAWQQNNVIMTVGSLTAGVLASTAGAPWTVGVMGAACAVGAVVIFLAIPHVRTIR